ncbi:MAG: hypothetical protein IT480_04750 [Gammaproteobacteria bacterium]|nr:hypothetical protein [Gammaproteobacteria bacterium]
MRPGPVAVPAAVAAPAAGVRPGVRPLRTASARALAQRFECALAAGDGRTGAHCIHERWMRGELEANIEGALTRLWARAAASVPDWLPMRYIEWLPLAYEVAARFHRTRSGRNHIYLVLLDYRDSRAEPYGVYVGMSRYLPAERFDQHKAGIRAAGSVLHRGLEVLTGPVLHLRHLARAEAAGIEENLAMALRAAGLFVQGGH